MSSRSSAGRQDATISKRLASAYYLSPRAQHPRAENKMLYLSFPHVMTFDASHIADVFLKQPSLLIAGEKAVSIWHSDKLDKLIGGATKKVIVPHGTYMDFTARKNMLDLL
ncbi:hypothetical protein ETB97_003702 [Aspergillus alliaceus]|uniref:Uncharacterized protein n=1 Tax=Petromyces alliaceus TaxID=209559 RepID=A0A5N6G8G4_PETAA|nr:uncharacterized protein BDW43DRAFT_306547 [Aspergillus alliaceus]KAB8238701.1 hypothetical protein BDW43DRAFT_306547 [Aspergillus alliaceus]KAF5865444.1 hypothetical protein ETB97_003702 [Aspergillus burnettii]